MDNVEFEKMLLSIPKKEQRYFQAWFISYQGIVSWEQFKDQGFRHVIKAVQSVKRHVEQTTGQPEQLKLAFMKPDRARISPFFPMSRRTMKDRPPHQVFTVENRWGKITISGLKLSIHDESVLLALMVLAKKHRSNEFGTTFSELCEVMKTNRGTNKYKAIRESIIRLGETSVRTELYEKDSQKKKIAETQKDGILSRYRIQEKNMDIWVVLGPYFYCLYGESFTVAIDLDKRAALKGDISKALYRFLESHKPSNIPFGLLTLCHGINLNPEQPLKDIRKKIKAALSELRKNKCIDRWRIDKADNVHITR